MADILEMGHARGEQAADRAAHPGPGEHQALRADDLRKVMAGRIRACMHSVGGGSDREAEPELEMADEGWVTINEVAEGRRPNSARVMTSGRSANIRPLLVEKVPRPTGRGRPAPAGRRRPPE